MEDLFAQVEKNVLPSQLPEVQSMLVKVFGNMVQNPNEPKYRTLKKDNKKVAENIAKHPSVVTVMLAVGFEDDGSVYNCPEGTDLEQMEEAVNLLRCMIESRGEAPGPETAPFPALSVTPAAPAVVATQPVQAAVKVPSPTPSPAHKISSDNVLSSDSQKSIDAKKKTTKSAFEFENRSKQVEKQQQAAQGLDDLRKLQKAKFEQFQSDPDAKKSEVYQQPPSSANGAKKDDDWGGWLGGLFGGGSSSSGGGGGGGGGGKPPRDQGGPRIKTVSDLPKPVQRG